MVANFSNKIWWNCVSVEEVPVSGKDLDRKNLVNLSICVQELILNVYEEYKKFCEKTNKDIG